MIRFILMLPVLFIVATISLHVKLALWPYVYALAPYVPWILGGCVVILIINGLVNGGDEDG